MTDFIRNNLISEIILHGASDSTITLARDKSIPIETLEHILQLQKHILRSVISYNEIEVSQE